MVQQGQQPGRPPGRRRLAGERRIVTALFCDVVNSTALAEDLDPEEWAEVMNGAVAVLAPPVERYEGTVNRLLGDALLALFGAPVAHEDDPQRAVRAALEMLEALRPYAEQVRKEYRLDFQVRIGINTGPTVAGDVGTAASMEYTAMGDAVNVAARMEQTARPGTVQIAEETRRLVAPLFDLEPLGPVEVKGKSEPIPAYRVIGARAQPGRLRGLGGVRAPLIGRDRELAKLREVLAGVRQGRGQIVCVIGDAGLGKSRLLEELKALWVEMDSEQTWRSTAGSPYDASRPYSLFHGYLRDMFGIDLNDPPQVIHAKVEQGLRAMGGSDEAIRLCSVSCERVIAAKVLHEAPDFSPDLIRQDIEGMMYPAWKAYVSDRPVVFMVDDLHWADQASVDLLLHLMPIIDEAPLLLIGSFRPERQSPAWKIKLKAETDFPHNYTEIMLQPLGASDTDALVSALLNIAELPEELRQTILRKSDGNPYFVEEIVRTLIDRGVVYQTADGLRWKAAASVRDISIPDTLMGLLLARMDRLDQEARSTLQLASVIGRTFYHRVLKAISDSALALDRHLVALQRVELVREAGRRPELEYIFKHELTRDAAYSSILLRRRRELHQQVGEAMEVLFAGSLEEHAHRLAQHFTAAGDHRRALTYRVMAGEVAAGLYANVEAAAHYAGALEAAQRLGEPPDALQKLRLRHEELVALSGSAA
jgi:class 3 adenylate cyclase